MEQIKKDIQNRPSSAIYNDNEIASWVLVHNDNSMGIMYTKDEYRNKGYAVDICLLSSIQFPNKKYIYSTFIRMVLAKEQSKGRELVFIHTSEELLGMLKEIGFRSDCAV